MNIVTTTAAHRRGRLSRAALVLAVPVLATTGIAGPGAAERGDRGAPPLPPRAAPAAGTATSMDAGGGPPPAPPAQPPAPQAHVPATLPASPAGTPPASGGGGSGPGPAPRTSDQAETPVVDTTDGERVVICKYVRKPHVAEVASHIIIVNEQALVGRGFTGSFPWPFSDAHFYSLAIRWAAPGEQAREVSLGSCPRSPAGEPGGEDGGGGPTGGDVVVPGAVEPGFTREFVPPTERPAAKRAGVAGALPQTGAPSGLEELLLLSCAALLAGVVLRVRESVLRRR